MFKKSLLIMLLMAFMAPWAAAQKALPYSYGFEYSSGTAAEALATEGWTLQNCKSSTGIVSSTSYGSPHTGTYYFQFAYQSNSNQWLVSPEFATSNKNIVVEFYYRKYTNGTETFKVGYSSTTTEADQFTFGDVITCTNTTYPSEPNYSNSFPAGTKYIAIAYVSNDEWYFNIDDISIDYEPDCPKPTALTSTNVTNNSATLGWTSNAESWNLQYKASGDADWTTINGVTNPYTLDGVLSERTTYQFQVQPVCGGTPGNYSSPASFTTTCNPKNLTYTMGFETSEATEFADWMVITNNSSSTTRSTSAKKTGSYGFAFYYQSTNQYLITPPLNASSGVNIEFYYKNSSSYTTRTFKVGYSTSSNNVNDFTWDDESTTAVYNVWNLYSNSFPANTKYIAILSETASSFSYIYIDDITLEAPAACEKPSGLTYAANTEDPIHKANLSWTAGGTETSWDIKYNAGADFNPETEGTLVENVTNPYTLTGLTGGITYYAYVRGHCPGGSDVSNWNSVVCTFTTENGCDKPTDLTATAIPGGANLSWDDGDNTPASWQIAYSTSYGSTPPANSTIVDVTTNPYTLEGLNYGTSYYSWVRTVCDDNDGTSAWSSYGYFTTLAQFPAPTIATTSATPDGAVVTWNKGYEETQWQIQLGVYENYSWTYTMVDEILDEQTYTFTGLTEQTSYRVQVRAYIDADHQSAWSNTGSFTTLASCPAPTNLNYSNLTATSVELDWTKGYQETAWNIQYKAGNAEWTTIENITDKPYTMTVSDATTYQVKIQNSCESDWSNTITFTTPCLPNTTFPFEEDFEDLTTSGEIPGCWNNEDGSSISTNYKWCYYASGTSYGSTVSSGVDGSKCIRFNSYNTSVGDINYLKTPVMNFPDGKTMVLGFYWKNPAGGELSVYISTDGGDTYTTELKTGMSGGQTTWKEEEIELTNYVGTQNVVIVFKGYSNSGAYNTDAYIYLDDVTISEKNDCAKPKDLAVSSYDNHSAVLSWDANGSEGPWEVAYSTTESFDLTDPTAYSVATANTNPFTLNGLTNLNTYYVRVHTVCGENYSEWNNNGYQSFTTTATYTAPTITGISEIGDQSATVAWETGDSEETPTHWTVWYKTGDTENTKTVEAANTSTQITGLTAGSAYEVKVRAQSGDDYSAWSTSENFQTAFCAAENQCNISYTLTDSHGDGWNASTAINVVYKATNTTITSLRLASGSSTTGTLALCNGAEYDFVWTQGGFDNYECGFIFTDVNNEVIYQHTGGNSSDAPTVGTLFTYTMDCTVETCTRPSDLTADAVHPNSVELSWTNEAGQEAWQIAYSTESFDPNAANFDLTTVSVADVDSNPFELEGLDNNTTYYAYVRAVCDATNDDYSKWSNTVCEFTTQVACPAPTNVHLASRPASNQLAIEWTAGYEETNWNFYYRVAGTEEWGSAVAVETTPTYTINGAMSTAYEVKVAAVCGGTEGGVSDVVTFSTPTNVTTATSFTENFNQSGCPAGWTAVSGVHNSYTYSWTFGGELASSSNYSEMYLVTPLLHLSDMTPILSYAQKRSSSNATPANIYVKISTTGIEKTDFSTTVWSGTTSNLTTSNITNTIDLSAYVNQDVYIAFFYNGTGGHYWHIDDVALTIENTLRTAGEWNTAANWSAGTVPTAEQNAYVSTVATISDEVSVNNIILVGSGSITIAEGGQLICNNNPTVTVVKHIEAAASWDDNTSGWNFIASPITSTLTTANVGGIVTTGEGKDYDLYKFNEADNKWHNYKPAAEGQPANAESGFGIEFKKGYLYASQNGTDINFTGIIQPYVEAGVSVTLEKVNEGWNLIGNPFTFNAVIDRSFYVINGNKVEANEGSVIIAPATGVMVKADPNDENTETVTFTKATAASSAHNQGNIQMTLSQQATNRGTAAALDNAIVSFNEGSQLEKFYFMQQNANLYIPQGNEEYAIVNAEAQGTMPVNFRANENGQYTLTVNAENVKMNYLHLIDNMTGADIDLLQTPSYSFNATTTDYESRFRLVFASNNEDGASTGSATFAFCSNGNWIISNEGEATLQVIDVNGRILSSESINGSVSKAIHAAAGVYVIRLINGDDVKVQKIVVR